MSVLIPSGALQIQSFYEGLDGLRAGKYYPYHCSADRVDVWTIGRGHVLTAHDIMSGIVIGGYTVDPRKGLTLDQVNSLWLQDCVSRAIRCKSLLGPNTSGNEFGAMFCLFYNNESAIVSGSPGRLHRAGEKKAAAEAILEYIYSNGKRQRGLWRRRMSESFYYLTDSVKLAGDSQSEQLLYIALSNYITVIRPTF